MKAPHFIVFAGPNGSGKSTFKDLQSEFDLDGVEYVNPDLITRERLGLGLNDPFPGLTPEYFAASEAAQAEAAALRHSAIQERRSICFETVMSHPSKVDDMERARAAGFDVVLFFLGLDDPRLNVRRVRERVAEGGHPVNERKIIQRYFRCMQLLERAVRASSLAVVYDTSVPEMPFDAIARVREGKSMELSGRANRAYWACEYLLRPFGLWAAEDRESQLFDIVENYLATGELPRTRRAACLEVAAEIGRSLRMAYHLDLPLADASLLGQHTARMASHRI